MRVINRTGVTVTGDQPFIDWMGQVDADFNKGAITVPRAKAYGSAFLLPEFDLEEELQEWVEENAGWLFEFQLAAWTENGIVVARRRATLPRSGNGFASTSTASWWTWPTTTSKEKSSDAAAPRVFQVQGGH